MGNGKDGMPPLVTPQQLADAMGGTVSAKTIRRACANGDVPAVKIGRKWFIPRDKLLGVA